MSLQACADLVQRGDPDRFLAAMAAPVAARRALFPLYAMAIEVARAPWVTEEPMIAEMRLQWWRDALEEIAEGRDVRKHEVTTPLAEAISPDTARALDRMVAARRWDIYKDAFEDEDHFADYLEATGGVLMWAAAENLGAAPSARSDVFPSWTADPRPFGPLRKRHMRNCLRTASSCISGLSRRVPRFWKAGKPARSSDRSLKTPTGSRRALWV